MVLIDAFRRYRDMTAEQTWDLTIAGDGPLYGAIARRVAELSLTEHVYLVGRKAYDELPALYASADAFVFPSLSETWGLVVNEAMAAGLPVLVSKGIGCHPDLVWEGINGHVFDPADTAQLATLLYEIASTPNRLAMGDASLRIIRDWDLNRFSSGLIEAAVAAYSSRSHKKPRTAVAMAAALSYRASMRAVGHTIQPE
jgi:glycosyltransferase involved in cell wall biosynthesis